MHEPGPMHMTHDPEALYLQLNPSIFANTLPLHGNILESTPLRCECYSSLLSTFQTVP